MKSHSPLASSASPLELGLSAPTAIFDDDFEWGDFREWSGVSGI